MLVAPRLHFNGTMQALLVISGSVTSTSAGSKCIVKGICLETGKNLYGQGRLCTIKGGCQHEEK